MRRLPQVRHVTTLHGRLDLEELVPLYDEFSDMPVVSISDAQRNPLPDAGWVATVYHGLPPGLFSLCPTSGRYLAFLGRISPEKRVDRAIAIATASGLPLKIAAKVDPADRTYFERTIAPLLDNPLVEFIGEISERHKNDFLGQAKALLFPIDWPEPFGLVMIEAMACGLPVIAFPGGSVARSSMMASPGSSSIPSTMRSMPSGASTPSTAARAARPLNAGSRPDEWRRNTLTFSAN